MLKFLLHSVGLFLLQAVCLQASLAQGTAAAERIDGWTNVIGAESTWTESDGIIRTTGRPKSVLRTDRQYENFILEFDFQADAGSAGLVIHAGALPAAGSPWPRGIDIHLGDRASTSAIRPIGGAMIEPVLPAASSEDAGSVSMLAGDEVPAGRGSSESADASAGGDASERGDGSDRGAGADESDSSDRADSFERGDASIRGAVSARGAMSARSEAVSRWRRVRVESMDGHVSLIIDGEAAATANYASPRKGYIALKSDGTEGRFRDVRVEELASTYPAPYEVADVDDGFVSMYDGLDLADGWEMKPGHRGHWTARDWLIDYDGASEERDKSLWTERSYGDFILIADVRLTREPEPDLLPVVLPSGLDAVDENGNPIMVEVPYAGDTGIYVRGSSKNQINIGNRYIGSGGIYGYRADRNMPPEVRRAVTPRVKANHPPGEWDRYIVTMIGDTLRVELNGITIIDRAHLPGIDPEGKIALQDDHAQGNTFQFANLYIKEIN